MHRFRAEPPGCRHAFGRITTQSFYKNYRIVKIDPCKTDFYIACPVEFCQFVRLKTYSEPDCYRCSSCSTLIPDDCFIVGMTVKGWAHEVTARMGRCWKAMPISIGSTALENIGMSLPFKQKLSDAEEKVSTRARHSACRTGAWI